MSYYMSPPAWREYVSGLYYNISDGGILRKTYLPQVELQAHATILSTASRTVLTQTFLNPSPNKWVREVRYTFPLYDGVSVVGFECRVGDRTIIGEVKEKEKARAVYNEAVARGETAGLLEQLPEASDVFTTTVGNIPAGARIVTKITYLGELKHDMEVDGIRYTIPNVICPRYGSYPGSLYMLGAVEAMSTSISITVDAEMADGSFIQKLQSPSHPIAMTMGTLSSAPNADPALTKASATLTLGTAQLDTDFVLQVVAKNTGVPRAMLENHPTIPNHRALMTTLVPKFSLPPEKPELVFVCDRSGSMGGTRIELVKQALKVFLKSLPVGVKFNICSFGSRYSFLWKRSVTYSQQTLDEAVRHAETFSADYGGTEMLKPLKATIEQRYKDMPLDVMLLTDGEIWNQQDLFTYLNKAVGESKSPIRLFTLGIGNGVSHALIEGVAKAGDGFSQTVGEGEKMDTKVVRMLKGALSPHIKDYTLEVKYSKSEEPADNDDDFEIVEKVADSLKMQLDLKDEKKSTKKKIISLFDTSSDPDKEEPPAYDETGESRYAHLPNVPVPKIIQAPQSIPSLFAFNRTTAYLLLGPEAPHATPKSVVLRGTSVHGPLELEIAIEVLQQPGETIHQLAAKKAISELEQGRGWLSEAKTQNGKLVKTQFEGRFEDMVEREAVRLGVQFQVGGKWCSFVAVEKNTGREKESSYADEKHEYLEDEGANNAARESPLPAPSQNGRPRFAFIDSDEEADMNEEITLSDTDFEALQSSVRRLKKLSCGLQEELCSQSAMLESLEKCQDHNVDPVIGDSASQNRRFERFRSKPDSNVRRQPPPGTPPPQASPHPSAIQRHQSQQAKVDTTAAVMRDNVDRLLARGERLEDLQSKSTNLAINAKTFYEQANKQKSGGRLGSFFGSSSPPGVSSAGVPKSSRGWFGGGSSLIGGAMAAQPSVVYSRSASSRAAPPAPSTAAPGAVFGAAPPHARKRSSNSVALGSPPPPPAPPGGIGNYSLGNTGPDMVLHQENKKRLMMVPRPSVPAVFKSKPAGASSGGLIYQRSSNKAAAADSSPSFEAAPTKSHSEQLRDYQMSLMLCEQQKKSTVSERKSKKSSSGSEAGSAADVMDFSCDDAGVEAALESFDFDSFLNDGPDEDKTRGPAPHAGFAPPGLFAGSSATQASAVQMTDEELTHYLISLQTFEGSWTASVSLLAQLKISDADLSAQCGKSGIDKNVFMTALVIAVFELNLANFEGSWELVVEKAKGWLGEKFGGDVEDLVKNAGVLVKKE